MQKLTDLLSDKAQFIIAFIIIMSGFAYLVWASGPEATNNRVEDLMFLVATYYFGSSKSGATKDATIASMANNQQPIVANSEQTNVTA